MMSSNHLSRPKARPRPSGRPDEPIEITDSDSDIELIAFNFAQREEIDLVTPPTSPTQSKTSVSLPVTTTQESLGPQPYNAAQARPGDVVIIDNIPPEGMDIDYDNTQQDRSSDRSSHSDEPMEVSEGEAVPQSSKGIIEDLGENPGIKRETIFTSPKLQTHNSVTKATSNQRLFLSSDEDDFNSHIKTHIGQHSSLKSDSDDPIGEIRDPESEQQLMTSIELSPREDPNTKKLDLSPKSSARVEEIQIPRTPDRARVKPVKQTSRKSTRGKAPRSKAHLWTPLRQAHILDIRTEFSSPKHQLSNRRSLSEESNSPETSDLETDQIKYEDSIYGCSPLAIQISKDMNPRIAKRYLEKARKYPGDSLPSQMPDMMMDLPPNFRKATVTRAIFESYILSATAHSEPDAPAIKIRNEHDDEPCPDWDFCYTNKMIYGDGVPKPSDFPQRPGCSCKGGCRPDAEICECARLQDRYSESLGIKGFLYNVDGCLIELQLPVFECHDGCGCSEYCLNRSAQSGRKHKISLQKTPNRGWGMFADEEIPIGAFLGVYSGELLLTCEGNVRGQTLYEHYDRNYLFDIDFHYLQQVAEEQGKKHRVQYTVDAMHAGCFTRYLNHSCDPNCKIVACIFGEASMETPYLAFFTRKAIRPGEEITFSYKGDDPDDPQDLPDMDKERVKKARSKVRRGKQKKADQSIEAQNHERVVLKIDVPCKCGSWRCNGSIWKWENRADSDEEEETSSSDELTDEHSREESPEIPEILREYYEASGSDSHSMVVDSDT